MPAIEHRTRERLEALSPFHEIFERATELALHALYAAAAMVFASRAAELDQAVNQHDEVLEQIARSIELDIASPLIDRRQEARAQWEAWMTPATWAVQVLMATLPDASDELLDEEAWVEQGLRSRHRPPRPTAIEESDEGLALMIAARALLRSDLRGGRALFLRERPLLVRVEGEGVIATSMTPTVLISQRERGQKLPPSLAVGDEVWLADERAQRPPVTSKYRQKNRSSAFVMTSSGELSVSDDEDMAAVVDEVWCYFRGT